MGLGEDSLGGTYFIDFMKILKSNKACFALMADPQ